MGASRSHGALGRELHELGIENDSTISKNGGFLMAKNGKIRNNRPKGLSLRVEFMQGSRIIDTLSIDDLETEDEGDEMMSGIQSLLEEDFGCEFEEE